MLYSLMDQIYEILIHKVTEYGGTVNELTGTGSMACSAPPLPWRMPPRGDPGKSAIHREMVQFNDKMRREKPVFPSPNARGIHTGPVVVGDARQRSASRFQGRGEYSEYRIPDGADGRTGGVRIAPRIFHAYRGSVSLRGVFVNGRSRARKSPAPSTV